MYLPSHLLGLGLLALGSLFLPKAGLGQVPSSPMAPVDVPQVVFISDTHPWRTEDGLFRTEKCITMMFDSLAGTWVPVDSARSVQLFKANERRWALRMFGPDWPRIEDRILGASAEEGYAYELTNVGLGDAAAKHLRRAIRLQPDKTPQLTCTLGDTYADRMRRDTTYWGAKKWFRKAETAYLGALRADRSMHRTSYNLGLLYVAYISRLTELGLEDRLRQRPSRPDWHMWERVRTNLERAYVIDPGHAPTITLLKRWYQSGGADENEQAQLLRTAKKRLKWQGAGP
jgi:tetratricopeptide (TPR) repeat protein